jgi:hypothetical protein
MIYIVEEIVPVKKFYVVESEGKPDLSDGSNSDEFMYLDSWDEENWDKAKYKSRKPTDKELDDYSFKKRLSWIEQMKAPAPEPEPKRKRSRRKK